MSRLQLATTVTTAFLVSMIGFTSSPENRHEGLPIGGDSQGLWLSEEVNALYSNGTRYQILFQEAQGNEANRAVRGNSIGLVGAWSVEQGGKLLVEFSHYDSDMSDEVFHELQQSIYDNPGAQNATDVKHGSSHRIWNSHLLQLSNGSKLSPPTLAMSEFKDIAANVTVTLTDAEHNTRPSRNGEALVEFNDKGEITHAAITIYKTRALYEEGLLGAVFAHELGHALGLGHSDKLESVMYPSLVIAENDNGEHVAIGNIGTCELTGLIHLYGIGDIDQGFNNLPKVDSLQCDL